MANHARPTPYLAHVIFYLFLFFHILLDLLKVTDRVSQLLQLVFLIFSLFSNNYFKFTALCWNTCGLFRA